MEAHTLQDRNPATTALNSVYTWFRPKRKYKQPSSLDLSPSSDENPELIALRAEIESLDKRLEFRDPWARTEIQVLLQGAMKAACTTYRAEGVDNMLRARALFQEAQAMFCRDVQTKNRIFYVAGLGLGVVAVVLVPLLLLWGIELITKLLSGSAANTLNAHISTTLDWMSKGAPLETIAPLFLFAGLGASASVLSRLTTIDLKDENSKMMVFVSAAARPTLAVIFASVIFVILSRNIINIAANGQNVGIILVAAFLCGYSERFASDILDRLPFAANSDGAPPPPSGNPMPPSGVMTRQAEGGNGIG